MKTTVSLFCSLVMSATAVFAQPQIDVPLTITDGIQSTVLHFGILPWAHFCIDPADSINGHAEEFLPPAPPGGIFDVRFIWPRAGGGVVCYDQGSWCDFRPFISAVQRDTFRLHGELGDGPYWTVSWPSGLSAYFTELRFGSINMLIDTLYADSLGGGFLGPIRSGGLVVSVDQPSPNAPEEFVLYQNYPNPFNPSTNIQFSIGIRQRVRLNVHDVLGREVATLVDGMIEAGEHSVQWNAQGMPTGVYIYRLTTVKATLTKTMLLLK